MDDKPCEKIGSPAAGSFVVAGIHSLASGLQTVADIQAYNHLLYIYTCDHVPGICN